MLGESSASNNSLEAGESSISSETLSEGLPTRQELERESTDTLTVIGRDLLQEIYQELFDRASTQEVSVPTPHGGYVYYARQEKGLPYLVHCRRKDRVQAEEQILIDLNHLARGHDYCSVRVMAVSPDHQFLAYGLDLCGDERLDLWIRDLGQTSGTAIRIARDVGDSLAWAQDSRTLFYTSLDPAHRAFQVRRHVFSGESSGSSAANGDPVVYEESDQSFRVGVSRTESGAYLVITAQNMVTSELRYFSAERPCAEPLLLQPRRRGIRCAMTHNGDHFYMLTNENGAVNFKLMQAPISAPERIYWRPFMLHREHVMLERIQAFAEHLVVWERAHGQRHLCICNLRQGSFARWKLPEPTSVIYPGDNREYNTHVLRIGYSSLRTPFSVLDYNMDTASTKIRKETKVAGGFHKENFVSRRLMAPSRDGTLIPISLVYRKDLFRVGKNPLLLHGYGAYGYSLEPEFDAARLSLLNRGFVYAIAHVRGGGEMGEHWHHQGRGLHKKSSIQDFIACAEYLIREKVTTSGLLTALGESAGGLLVAAAMNERPELFSAVVADCPFVDVSGALSDPSLPLTVSDWDEWGHPEIEEERDYMASYSPCNNIKKSAYPAILATAGLNDPWVPPSQPIQWIRQLRDTSRGHHPILFFIDLKSGHRGPSNRFDFLRETALKYAFLISQVKTCSNPVDSKARAQYLLRRQQNADGSPPGAASLSLPFSGLAGLRPAGFANAL